MRDEFVSCPVCGKHGRLLTNAGAFRKHDDTVETTAWREWTGTLEHQTCAAWGCTPEQAAKAVTISPPIY
jgi:hypothetical protein